MFIRFCFGSWGGRSLVVSRWSLVWWIQSRFTSPTLCKERKEWGTLIVVVWARKGRATRRRLSCRFVVLSGLSGARCRVVLDDVS